LTLTVDRFDLVNLSFTMNTSIGFGWCLVKRFRLSSCDLLGAAAGLSWHSNCNRDSGFRGAGSVDFTALCAAGQAFAEGPSWLFTLGRERPLSLGLQAQPEAAAEVLSVFMGRGFAVPS
jgi:hypothetical protein